MQFRAGSKVPATRMQPCKPSRLKVHAQTLAHCRKGLFFPIFNNSHWLHPTRFYAFAVRHLSARVKGTSFNALTPLHAAATPSSYSPILCSLRQIRDPHLLFPFAPRLRLDTLGAPETLRETSRIKHISTVGRVCTSPKFWGRRYPSPTTRDRIKFSTPQHFSRRVPNSRAYHRSPLGLGHSKQDIFAFTFIVWTN